MSSSTAWLYCEKALARLLGSAAAGTIVFARCLPDELLAVAASRARKIGDWEVYVVGEAGVLGQGAILGDRAVELREEKIGCRLFLVHANSAGAGMDGIYNSASEILERELFDEAVKQVKKGLPKEVRTFAEHAVRVARRLGRVNTISPWREFLFYDACARASGEVGGAIALLGLWPIDSQAGLRPSDLEVSAGVVERLLLPQASAAGPRARVESLLLGDADQDQARQLEELLAETAALRWTDAVVRASDQRFRELWLNRLVPGFARQNLAAIELVPWRSDSTSVPQKWSGLSVGESNGEGDMKPLAFVVPVDTGAKAKLEVRWKVKPEGLPPGLVDYRVSILTGSDQELLSATTRHSGKAMQKCVLAREDFEGLDEGGQWEVRIRVHPVDRPPSEDGQPSAVCVESEEFLLKFGEVVGQRKSSASKKVRALVEAAIGLEVERFSESTRGPISEDAQGFVGFRVDRVGGRVYRPPLVKRVEEDWRARDFALGRWVVRVREDGAVAPELDFIPLKPSTNDSDVWRKFEDAARAIGQKVMDRGGFVGQIYTDADGPDRYVNAFSATVEAGEREVALLHTVEVQSTSGRQLGLLVLPGHPLRVAWHQAYDTLACHARYGEQLTPGAVLRALSSQDGAFLPALLPGVSQGETFVFTDTIGFHVVAMTSGEEAEPQAVIGLLRRALSSDPAELAAAVSATAIPALGREITRYMDLHPDYRSLHVHALRPGDGYTVARALGCAQEAFCADGEGDDVQEGHVGFVLNLFPAAAGPGGRDVGRYLQRVAEARRTGAGSVSTSDTWMLGTYDVNGVALPRLKWAKRSGSEPEEPAHLAVAFDTFTSDVQLVPQAAVGASRPIEVFGLTPSVYREFRFDPLPTWTTTLAPNVEGEKHPTGRGISERVQRAHAAVMKAVASHLGGGADEWPVLRTCISAERADAIHRLHELSDWVIGVDRHTGIEYFDAPRDAAGVYEAHLIDCVPERQDLDFVRLVTSTCNIGEVMRLLDRGFGEMGLACTAKTCGRLLSELKAVSGRLAMGLLTHAYGAGESVALALFHRNCVANSGEGPWPSLSDGFVVPMNDVRELLFDEEEPARVTEESENNDLLYVDLSKRGGLQFSFVALQYRRLLPSAMDRALHESLRSRVSSLGEAWNRAYLSLELTQTQKATARKRLARVLHFYADKARRHDLSLEPFGRLKNAIDRLYRSDTEATVDARQNQAYVFCPDFRPPTQELDSDDRARLFIFGPQGLTEATPPSGGNHSSAPVASVVVPAGKTAAQLSPTLEAEKGNEPEPHIKPVRRVRFGLNPGSQRDVDWTISLRGNPHLMIVGQPGMGKTTCILNLCRQLVDFGLVPIVFSYHSDIEAGLRSTVGEVLSADLENGLGYNPLRVTRPEPIAWVDNVGMLRDIFAAVFPDLGDLQTNEIRRAIRQSYSELGYDEAKADPRQLPVPPLQRFFDILRAQPKPNAGVLARLEELDDYGFFRSTGADASLLDATLPTLVRLHSTQNSALQNAMASFALLNIYQNMFLRGPQTELRHVVVFDEAHRASRLKLLPTMAKECRKFGISLIVASQESKDFDSSLYAAIANYLVFRVGEADARVLAKNVVQQDSAAMAGRLRQLAKYTGYFFCEGQRPTFVHLDAV